jgi:hypothetical protein
MVRRVRDSDPNCVLIQAALNHSVVERREIQLHADVVGIVEEDLRLTTARHDLLAELHIPGLQSLPNTVEIGCGKGDMVQAAGGRTSSRCRVPRCPRAAGAAPSDAR